MSNALTGPTSTLGIELSKGANTYFDRLNKLGGIHGRPVELMGLDDGYEPENTVINTKKFIEKDVLALFGYVGTPTSHSIMPLLTKTKIPYLMPFTGADFLRTSTNNIFNLRASYAQELAVQLEYLTSVQAYKKIALVIQADEFGLAAQRVVNKVLAEKHLKVVTTARYRRNTNNIQEAFTQLMKQPVDAVIFVGTYQPFVDLIRLSNKQGLNALFTGLSFIGAHNLFNELPANSRVIVSEVMPDPKSCGGKICQQFRYDMAAAGFTQLNRVQFEGYINAFVFNEVAKQCQVKLTQQCLIEQFELFEYQDSSLTISFKPKKSQGVKPVYFSFSYALEKKNLSPLINH